MRITCQHRRARIDVSDVSGSPRQTHRRGGAGDGRVVCRAAAAARPSLEDGLPRGGQVLQATSMHEQLRTVGRLLELSEACDECGVPLCEDCASGVLRELQRQLEEAHAEREVMQSAFAELEAGDEDVAEDETLSEADFERELQAMRREEDELRAALEAAKRERRRCARKRRGRGQRRGQEEEEEARTRRSTRSSSGGGGGGRAAPPVPARRAPQRELERPGGQRYNDVFSICTTARSARSARCGSAGCPA